MWAKKLGEGGGRGVFIVDGGADAFGDKRGHVVPGQGEQNRGEEKPEGDLHRDAALRLLTKGLGRCEHLEGCRKF